MQCSCSSTWRPTPPSRWPIICYAMSCCQHAQQTVYAIITCSAAAVQHGVRRHVVGGPSYVVPCRAASMHNIQCMPSHMQCSCSSNGVRCHLVGGPSYVMPCGAASMHNVPCMPSDVSNMQCSCSSNGVRRHLVGGPTYVVPCHAASILAHGMFQTVVTGMQRCWRHEKGLRLLSS